MTPGQMTLGQSLIDLAVQMTPVVKTWPRRKPGLLMAAGKALRYADLHSLYYQVRQIYGERIYDFRARRPDPRILDCGAHIGLASLFFKEHYPTARITAIEADGDLADMCRANFATFGASDIAVVEAAAWTHCDGVIFSQSHDDAGHVDDTNAAMGDAGVKVPSVRLKSLLEEAPVDLLKLDVEGAEMEIIRDCGDALRAVDRLVMEVHAMDGQAPKIGPLLQTLERQSFRYVLGDLHQATWMPEAPTPFSYCHTGNFIVSVFAWQE